jgi:lipoprotein NlpD
MSKRLVIVLLSSLLLTACSATSWREPPQTHIVRSGETLFAIAWRYGKSSAELARWNRLGDGSLIYPGQVLKLAGPASSRSPAKTATAPKRGTTRPLPSIVAQPPPKWSWPAGGQIDVEFGAKPGPGTGVLINGKQGQAVYAAADGRVVYAGGGLIGYGKLIILKHNDTYLSAYGYNASLQAKEGDEVTRGQRIASMGEGPERQPRLHFEIRRNGEPVDPRRYLPRQ